MKRIKINLLLLLQAILVWNVSQALTFVTSDAKMENLKGPVKSVKTYSVAKSKYFDADTYNEYKRTGKPLPEYEKSLVSEAEYNLSGMKTYENNWFIEHTTFNPENDRTLMFETEKRYAQDGSLHRTYSQTFDEDWLPASGVAYDGNGNLVFTESYEKKRLPDGRINLYSEHTIADGATTFINIIMRPDLSMEKLSQKSVSYRSDISFDEEEKPIRVYEYRNGKGTNIELEYSSDGRKIYHIDEGGNRKLTDEFKNDEFGNPLSIIEYKDNGEVEATTYTYIYDNHHNWVRKESKNSRKSEPEILERVISYY